ncbi:pyridoxamine 5'-phosphate oxidase family protein [Aeromicrobium sp. 636]|uniref:Pyridoxamine 5'-phosphate oxidase family protein n=1 Tax=Aeromicrobium senzhongii TaxID=2663859 RepID=A0A8I0K0X0_9ACTN|nr:MULTISPECIES: pyridoxamine 5'-phosphate oxidase family protein [Aeromicrobium]MBC9226268.1 pyridoxamine 5'-phosphate oxidase family protein [Aeromicrobium senzhongii]MCQ3998374.1 pyridoxamine 5'-phosphate oxidase family protein [Aeromicrobium sp. 636]
MTQIQDEAELRAILGRPLQRALDKDRDRLTTHHVEWLRHSPVCLLGTSGADGSCDVSPKGDPAGSLVHVIDDRRLALAERPGNRRADGYANILANPHVGLVFLIPGRGDTLRVNGRARLLRTDDGGPDYVDALVVKGRRPVLVCEVEVEQVFFHCAKAFLRSQLWDPTTWRPDAVPSRAEIAHAMERPDDSVEELEAYYGAQYSTNLY